VRQWVLSLPFRLRYRLAYDARLTGEVLRILVRRVFASLRRRARLRRPIADPECGAVTFVQRFGGALNLNVHFHTLVLDGVYDPGDGLRFRPLPPPAEKEVERVARSVARGIARLLERRGLGPEADPEESDPLARDEPLLAALGSASVGGRIAMGPRAGQRVLRFGDHVEVDHLPTARGQRCATVNGVSLHANGVVPPRDRGRLERLCRYAARPALATERLSRLSDGRLLYALKQRWRDGTTHIGFEPLELLEKLAALVPPPRFHLVRYHGVLAPAARHRASIVPKSRAPGPATSTAHPGCPAQVVRHGRSQPQRERAELEDAPATPRPRNYSWAELMRRVFEVDVLQCPACRGPMRILAAIHPPEATRAILECLGLPTRAPPLAPASPAGDTSPDLNLGL
jgi:hypothetical protein